MPMRAARPHCPVSSLVALARADGPGTLVFGGPSARFIELETAVAGKTVATLGEARLALGRLPSLPSRVLVTSELQGLEAAQANLIHEATLCRPVRIDRRASVPRGLRVARGSTQALNAGPTSRRRRRVRFLKELIFSAWRRSRRPAWRTTTLRARARGRAPSRPRALACRRKNGSSAPARRRSRFLRRSRSTEGGARAPPSALLRPARSPPPSPRRASAKGDAELHLALHLGEEAARRGRCTRALFVYSRCERYAFPRPRTASASPSLSPSSSASCSASRRNWMAFSESPSRLWVSPRFVRTSAMRFRSPVSFATSYASRKSVSARASSRWSWATVPRLFSEIETPTRSPISRRMRSACSKASSARRNWPESW